MSSVVLLREMAQDETQDIAVRVGCLRKFFEHTVSEPRDNSPAYNILSSLIHGRDYPSVDNEGLVPMQRDSIDCGNLAIREYIPAFDYARMLSLCEPQRLLQRYWEQTWSYSRLLILRAYCEQQNEARARLIRYNDILRKYVDETYHIENDYIFSLDVRRFDVVPDFIISAADEYMRMENLQQVEVV